MSRLIVVDDYSTFTLPLPAEISTCSLDKILELENLAAIILTSFHILIKKARPTSISDQIITIIFWTKERKWNGILNEDCHIANVFQTTFIWVPAAFHRTPGLDLTYGYGSMGTEKSRSYYYMEDSYLRIDEN